MSSDRSTGRVVDLTDAAAIAGTFAQMGEDHGGVDALVNNAGTCFMSDFPNIPSRELDREMALDFSGGDPANGREFWRA